MLAERFHMDEGYLKALNPRANFSRVGTIIRVANIGQPIAKPVTRVVADKGDKAGLRLRRRQQARRLYPATIGSTDTPSPTGTHLVSRVVLDPRLHLQSANLNFKQGENNKILTIPPGPNGPVGSVWIALDKPTYGVHGTPEPSKICKTERASGCVRLTNRDAQELAKLVNPARSPRSRDSPVPLEANSTPCGRSPFDVRSGSIYPACVPLESHERKRAAFRDGTFCPRPQRRFRALRGHPPARRSASSTGQWSRSLFPRYAVTSAPPRRRAVDSNAYAVKLSALILAGGAAGDNFRLRRTFVIGIVRFRGLARLRPGARSTWLADRARAVQGIGAAIMVPGQPGDHRQGLSRKERGRAIGIWAASSASTTALGPVIGGAIFRPSAPASGG